MLLAIEVGQVRPHQHAHLAGRKVAALPGRQGTAAAEQLEDRPGQGQRLELIAMLILEQAETHARPLSASMRERILPGREGVYPDRRTEE